jgi:hypothetical protein
MSGLHQSRLSAKLMKTTLRYLIPLAAAAALVAGAGCSSIPVQSHQAAGASTYPPTDPGTVEILRQAPTQAYVKLGEITAEPQSSSTFITEVEAKLREAGAKMGANAPRLAVWRVPAELDARSGR